MKVRKVESEPLTCDAVIGEDGRGPFAVPVLCNQPAVLEIVAARPKGPRGIGCLCVRHALRLAGELTSVVIEDTEEG